MSGIERVGVIGSGLMGSGIVEVASRAGLDVVLIELSDDAAKAAAERIQGSLRRAEFRGRLEPDEVEAVLAPGLSARIVVLMPPDRVTRIRRYHLAIRLHSQQSLGQSHRRAIVRFQYVHGGSPARWRSRSQRRRRKWGHKLAIGALVVLHITP